MRPPRPRTQVPPGERVTMKKLENCSEVLKLVPALLDEEIDPASKGALEEHTSWCRRCAAEIVLEKGLAANLKKMERQRAPAELLPRVMEEVLKPPLLDRIVAWFTPARAGGLALAGAVLAGLFVLMPWSPTAAPEGTTPMQVAGDARDDFSEATVLARIVAKGHGVTVAGEPLPQDGTWAVSAPTSLEVPRGARARIELLDGSTVEVSEDTHLDLTGEAIELARGEVDLSIQPQQKGFRVVTRNTVVTVLGTRYQVSFDGETRVHVDRGRVEVRPDAGPARVLTAGQEARVAESGRFADELPSSLAPVPFNEGGTEPEDTRLTPTDEP